MTQSAIAYLLRQYIDTNRCKPQDFNNLIVTDAIEMEERRMKEFALMCLKMAEKQILTHSEYEELVDRIYEENCG